MELAKDGVSEYVIVYPKENNKGGALAYSLNQAIGAKLTAVADDTAEIKNEILLGDTSRALSKDLKAHVHDGTLEDSLVWGFAYRDGQFAFYFSSQTAFEKGLTEFKEKFIKDGSFTVKSDTWYKNELTLADYNEELRKEEEAKKEAAEALKKAELKKREEAAIEALKKFKDEDFGVTENWKTTYSMPTNVYNSPASKITEAHPRLFLTKDTVPKIKALLEDSEYVKMRDALFVRADSKDFTGEMPTTYARDGESSRYSQSVLARIEARAMAYLLTGDKAYGYEAIMGIKNAMLTLKYTKNNHMDVYHGPSHVMFILAEVYDWCYDLLTEQDKAQLISGCVYLLIEANHLTNEDFVLEKHYPSNVSYGLEFNFPPDNMNAVTGHGAGPQFLRDYMMVTVAFSDEVPSWWEYVGGRFFDEYLPVAELLYESGNVSQGMSCYAPNRIFTNLIPAFLLLNATGENPYPDYLKDCSGFLLSHLMGNGRMYETGDGARTGNGADVYYAPFYLFAALYNDTFSLQAAKFYSNGFTTYTEDSIYTMGPALTLALCAVCDKATGNYPDD
ncbi:MAG: DUF4962 domain-containing protein, partial [Clostridia bacterium]|nr:DUF4962 domain-containing protein [Clostridia bacterium]